MRLSNAFKPLLAAALVAAASASAHAQLTGINMPTGPTSVADSLPDLGSSANAALSREDEYQIGRMTMLTEALRSYVMRVAWEHDMKIHSCNAGLAMNYSTDVVQEVTELYMEVRGANGCHMDAHADKLVRDAFIWNHLAGDSVQRMKVARRLAA